MARTTRRKSVSAKKYDLGTLNLIEDTHYRVRGFIGEQASSWSRSDTLEAARKHAASLRDMGYTKAEIERVVVTYTYVPIETS